MLRGRMWDRSRCPSQRQRLRRRRPIVTFGSREKITRLPRTRLRPRQSRLDASLGRRPAWHMKRDGATLTKEQAPQALLVIDRADC